MKLIIVGGGASGLMLASILKEKKANIDIEIIEKYEHVGKKILLTGNGRCNLTNINLNCNCYNNERGYQISSSFNTVEYFNSLGLLTVIDEEGRVYPLSNVSNSVLDILRESIKNINIVNKTNIIRVIKQENNYKLLSDNKETFEADMVVIATGGRTYYKDSNSYVLASILSHRVTMLRPTLLPIKVKENLASIENIRSKVKAKLLLNNQVIYEDVGEVLFKKDALSGIVIFQLSSIIAKDISKKYIIELDLLKDYCKEEIVIMLKKHPSMIGMFPKMINQYILKRANSNDLSVIADTIKHLRFNVVENVDFKLAQVTAGGVNLNELDDNLESKINKNVYFAGEIVDVDGKCGGYNLQFAFASANKIAESIINKVGIKDE